STHAWRSTFVQETDFDIGADAVAESAQTIDGDGSPMEKVFDTDLLIRRKKRALAAGAPDADFLMRRVAEDLGERLSAIERQFGHAVALFCQTAAAAEILSGSGKAQNVLRIE